MIGASTYEHARYVCTPQTALETLERFGVAIVENVLTADECAASVGLVWDFLEHATQEFETPLQRNDTSTFGEFYKLYPKHGMLVQHWGIGHSQFNWTIRQTPAVANVFSHIWGVPPEDLLVSFDGASVGLPWEETNRGHYRDKMWLHVDQRLSDSSFKCVQSWVTPLDVRAGDATLVFIEGSHRHHGEFAQQITMPKEKVDWFKFNDVQLEFYTRTHGLELKCIMCPAGSMVLWDSRLVHAGIEPQKWRAQPNFRMVSYVCMVPRSRATSKDLEKKRRVFAERRTTSHWPVPIKQFGKTPHTYGAPLPPIATVADPQLTDLGRRLAGLT